jgi:hypothetical protein
MNSSLNNVAEETQYSSVFNLDFHWQSRRLAMQTTLPLELPMVLAFRLRGFAGEDGRHDVQ